LNLYSADERLKGISPDEVLKRYSAEDRLKDLTLEEIQKALENLRRKTQ
jgi:hypothetical protein